MARFARPARPPLTAPWLAVALAAAPVFAGACRGKDDPVQLPDRDPTPQELSIEDVAVSSGYVDTFHSGTWKRGRAAVAGDFDGDGRWDVFSGNPGNESFVLFNRSDADGIRFEAGPDLGSGEVMWGAVAGDLDNDGDTDLYVSVGGNENYGEGLDRLYLNDGSGQFVDRSQTADIWPRQDDGLPFHSHHASAFLWDMDLDGQLDVFTNHNVVPPGRVRSLDGSTPTGVNGMLRNDGTGHFVDMAVDLGLTHQWGTRSSVPFDFDNDGDIDLYENNWSGPNLLWRNLLVETGELAFEDVTAEMSRGGGDLHYPGELTSQAAIAYDFDHDGWQDLFIFRSRLLREAGEPLVHDEGHLLWMNLQGEGFVQVAQHTGVNEGYVSGRRTHFGNPAVMGCQAGDLNADGILDLFMGLGSPDLAELNDLMVSTGTTKVVVNVGTEAAPIDRELLVPSWESWGELIDFPSEADTLDDLVSYPYRTHGASFFDADGDGLYELGVHNGGPHFYDELVQEPNRLFRFDLPGDPAWLRLDLQGDGVAVSRDAIGARVRVQVRDPDGGSRWVFGTQGSSSGFGSQNDGDLFLGLADAESIEAIVVQWPGGAEQEVEPVGLRQRQTVRFTP